MWSRGPTDKAPDYGSGDFRFECCRDRNIFCNGSERKCETNWPISRIFDFKCCIFIVDKPEFWCKIQSSYIIFLVLSIFALTLICLPHPVLTKGCFSVKKRYIQLKEKLIAKRFSSDRFF